MQKRQSARYDAVAYGCFFVEGCFDTVQGAPPMQIDSVCNGQRCSGRYGGWLQGSNRRLVDLGLWQLSLVPAGDVHGGPSQMDAF